MGGYLGNGLYKDNNNKLWILSIRIKINNSAFYSNSSNWINNNIFNENIYDLSNQSNSKYNSFNTIKTNKIMIQMNNKDIVCTLPNDYKQKTLYELFNNSSSIQTLEYFNYDPWFNFSLQNHIIQINTRYTKIGIVNISSKYPYPVFGVGINYYTESNSSSMCPAGYNNQFYPCNIYVEYPGFF